MLGTKLGLALLGMLVTLGACDPDRGGRKTGRRDDADSSRAAAPGGTKGSGRAHHDSRATGSATPAPSTTRPPSLVNWPLPIDKPTVACKLHNGEPGLRFESGGDCFNPCPTGMGPEKGEAGSCARLCQTATDCPGGKCGPDGVCDLWPPAPACDAPEFCETPDGQAGNRCKPADRCVSPCKKGHVLYGGTHCAKPCKAPADCPGGECAEGICAPLCPSEGCPYRWE